MGYKSATEDRTEWREEILHVYYGEINMRRAGSCKEVGI